MEFNTLFPVLLIVFGLGMILGGWLAERSLRGKDF